MYIGELAALGTAFCWGFTSIFFTMAGRMVGSPVVNRVRLVLALVFVGLFHFATQGSALPLEAEGYRWGWLGLSGIIGYVIGDALLFQAFVLLGARLSMLMMALAPVFSVLMGWTLLHEKLSAQALVGITLAVGGVAWVITDKNGEGGSPTRTFRLGLLFGLGGALGQAAGLIASKKGLDGDFPAISGNMIRLLVSTTVIWLLALGAGHAKNSVQKLVATPRALVSISIGAVFGPFIGVTLSLVAVQHAPVGIASTLMGLTPVILLPVSYFAFKEQIGVRAVAGTLLAVAGTALIFLR